MGVLETIFTKLGPRMVGVALVLAIAFLGLTGMYAVATGRSVDFWGLKIGETPHAQARPLNPPATEASKTCERALEQAKQRTRELSRRLDESITRSDLAELWPLGHSKQSVVTALLTKPAPVTCPDDDTAECRYEKLLNRIGESGGAIDLLHTSKDTVILIQRALSDVGAYEGELDGNAAATKRSLIAFQRKFRIRTNTDTIEGLMGRKTLEQIRRVRRTIVDGT